MQVDLTLSVDGEAVQLVGDMNIFSDRKTSNIIQLVHKEGSKVSEKYLMRTIVDTRIAEALKLENKLNYESTYLACKDRLFSLSADNNSGCNSLETWARLYKSVMNEPISLDLKSAGKIAADKPYRDAFAQMLEDSTDPYSRFGLSEAMKVLSHDREAVDCSEKYLEHYQYVKPRGKLSKDGDKDKDKGTPHWIEVEDGEQS
jgi:exonuclease V gamma subunit